MNKYAPHIIIVIFITLVLSLAIQLITPVPDRLDICGDNDCQNSGQDLIAVKQEDYQGLIIQIVGSVLLAGLVSVAISTFMKQKPYGVYLIVSAIIYAVLRSWVFNYGRWPTPTYLGVSIGIVLTGLFFIFTRHLVAKIKH